VSFLLTGNQQASAGVNNASFLPADYIQRKAEIRNNLVVLSLFALVMMGVGGAFYMTNRAKVQLGQEYSTLRQACEEESKQIEALKKLQEQRAVMLEKAEITAALLEPVPRWAVLAELRYRMPEAIRLDSFEIKGSRSAGSGGAVPNLPKIKTLVDNAAAQSEKAAKPKVVAPSFEYTLTVSGTATNNNEVADYLQSLKASPVLNIREQREEKEVLRKFEITATLRSETDQAKLGESIRSLIAKGSGNESEPAKPQPTSPQTPGNEAKPAQPANQQVSEAKEGQ
jgi:Tfp pilus assembly protein PilN